MIAGVTVTDLRTALSRDSRITVIAARTISSSKVKKHKNYFLGTFANIKDVYLTIMERAPN